MTENRQTIIKQLRNQTADYNTKEIIAFFLNRYRDRIIFSTSLAAEDQVLTDIICQTDKSLKIFTLDTGRLPQETYDTIEATRKRYEIDIDISFPDSTQVQELVKEAGPNLFYNSIQQRRQCCQVRKIQPLRRALTGFEIWICGLRKEQSVTRADLEIIQWDQQFNIIKLSPLLDWTTDEVWNYIRSYNVPYNSLHDRGYPSIGCQPCTRAVADGEDIRSGRWWWEKPEQKECGLHLHERK